MNKSNKKLY